MDSTKIGKKEIEDLTTKSCSLALYTAMQQSIELGHSKTENMKRASVYLKLSGTGGQSIVAVKYEPIGTMDPFHQKLSQLK